MPKPTAPLPTRTPWTGSSIVFNGVISLEKGSETVKEVNYGFSLPLTAFHFNTVQGYNAKINLFYNRQWEKQKKSLRINAYNVYGFSDMKNYPGIRLDYLMNKVHYTRLLFHAERRLVQFDGEPPISLLVNDIYSLFLKENYAKWYENTKIEAQFSSFLSPAFLVSIGAAHLDRNSRQNTTDESYFNKEKTYQSNTPINAEYDFQTHALKKYGLFCNTFPKTNTINTPMKGFTLKRIIIPG